MNKDITKAYHPREGQIVIVGWSAYTVVESWNEGCYLKAEDGRLYYSKGFGHKIELLENARSTIEAERRKAA